MAAVISKTAQLRRTYRLFSSYTSSLSRVTPHFTNYKNPNSLLHRPLNQSVRSPSIQSPQNTYLIHNNPIKLIFVEILQELGSFTLPRFLSANAQADSPLKQTTSDSQSDQGKQSGDSNQGSEQGKSIRGGVIFIATFKSIH